jgi:apolipoprotein N-acyltransferase
MLRATNTGLTAIVDAKGRVQKSLQSQDRDILLGQVQGMAGATPFNRWGNKAVLVLLALAALVAWLQARHRRTGAAR